MALRQLARRMALASLTLGTGLVAVYAAFELACSTDEAPEPPLPSSTEFGVSGVSCSKGGDGTITLTGNFVDAAAAQLWARVYGSSHLNGFPTGVGELSVNGNVSTNAWTVDGSTPTSPVAFTTDFYTDPDGNMLAPPPMSNGNYANTPYPDGGGDSGAAAFVQLVFEPPMTNTDPWPDAGPDAFVSTGGQVLEFAATQDAASDAYAYADANLLWVKGSLVLDTTRDGAPANSWKYVIPPNSTTVAVTTFDNTGASIVTSFNASVSCLSDPTFAIQIQLTSPIVDAGPG